LRSNATIPLIGIIVEIGHNSQSLDACPASQQAGCVFLAAYSAVFRLIFGQRGCRRQIVASAPPFRRRKYGSTINAPVMKRLPESS
jgi:hypothetical protein